PARPRGIRAPPPRRGLRGRGLGALAATRGDAAPVAAPAAGRTGRHCHGTPEAAGWLRPAGLSRDGDWLFAARPADEIDRIDLAALVQHLEMQVRAGRAAGVAHERHGLAFLHLVADLHEVLGVVRIAGGVAVPVIDLDHLAVA